MTMLIDLPRAVRIAARLTPQRAPVPIAACILLQPGPDGGVHLRATDLTVQIDLYAPGSIDGAIAVPSRILNNLIGRLPEVELHVPPRSLQLQVKGPGLEACIYGMQAEDFPPAIELKDAYPMAFDRERFVWCCPTAARDHSRPVLTGVALNRDTGAVAASDGFRLRHEGGAWEIWHAADGKKPADILNNSDKDPRTVVVPASLRAFLPPTVHEAKATPNGMQAQFDGEWRVQANLIAGTFPNFAWLIPESHVWRLADCSTAAWQSAARWVSNIAKDASGIVRIEGDGTEVTLSARAEEWANGSMKVPASPHEPFKVAVNFKFLLDALQGAPETFELSGTKPDEQVVFRYGERVEILMPMFVQWS